jgi:hypothetical protein
MNNNFAAFILSHGRADRVFTYQTIRKAGYSGRIVVIIDNQDKQVGEYRKRYGDQLYIFNKEKTAKTTDHGDNFNNLRTTTHVRNAIFQAARELGIESFVMLDDDYTDFRYKFSARGKYGDWLIKKNLDRIFNATIDFLKEAEPLLCVAYSQGGDFIGGAEGSGAKAIRTKRKVMNSFFCLTSRPFKFLSRLNEDVNTYVTIGARGGLFLTINQFALQQCETQTNAGGMSDAYLDSGTFVKSFYTVMYAPSCTRIAPMGAVNPRLHHKINWRCAVPKILAESVKRNA